MKRLIAALLTAAMVVSVVPFSVFAEESGTEFLPSEEQTTESTVAQQEEMAHALESTYNPFGRTYAPAQAEEEQAQQATDTTDVQLSGNGVLGNMLADRINTLTAENGVGYSPDYGITDIVMDGSHATVTYKSAEAADLVVACYTEDTQEMVTSGTVRVAATADGTAELTIDNIPDYYIVKGFLFDDEHAPLCNAYTKSLYTETMDQVKQATTKDFEEDRVLNLDQNLDTNFMVVGEDVSLMQDETSTVYADEDNQIYRFTNPGEELTSLEPGDVFVYEDDLGGFVVAKVKEITWEDNTLVITGDPDFDPSEAFDVIKVDDAAEAGDFTATHDENTGVPFAYDSIDEMENDIISFDEENSAPSGATTITGGVTDEIPLNDKTGGVKSIYGKIGYSVTGSVTYYFRRASLNLEYLQLKAGAEAYLDGGFTVSTDDYLKIPLGHAQARLAAGTLLLEIDAAFKMQLEVTGSVYLKASAESMITWENGKKDEDNTKSTFNAEAGVKLEGKIYAGISLTAAVTTMGELLKTEAELSAGSELTLTLNNDDLSIGAGINMDKYDSKHSCAFCVDITGERNCILTVSIKIWKYRLLENGKQTGDNEAKWTAFYLSWPMDDAYYSSDHDEFGWGSCPHRSYKVVVTAKNANGQALNAQGVKVYSRDADGKVEEVGAFDAKNTCKFFLPNGTYTIYAALNDSETYQTVTVDSKKAEVELRAVSAAGTALSGTCGENVNWKLTTDGQLIISGTGSMYDYDMYGLDLTCDNPAPWWNTREMISKYPITSLVIQNGVTHIGDCAFLYAKLTDVTIPGSVESIGYYAFSSMKTLKNVKLGEGVQSIGTMAFLQCNALEKLELPSTLTEIGSSAFSGCGKLKKLELPDGITEISSYAFNACSSLKEVVIPGSVQSLGMYAFGNCTGLEKATIWKGTGEIGWYVFAGDTALKTAVIPASVTSISYGAFDGCTTLETVIYGGTEEEWNAIDIKSSNEPLQKAAVQYDSESTKTETSGSCGKSLTWELSDDGTLTVHFKGIGFNGEMDNYDHVDTPWNVNKVKKVVLEPGVTTIGAYAFNGCRNLTEVQLPENVETVGTGAFGGCTSLKELTFSKNDSEGLTTIKTAAFAGSALEHISLPDTLTTLEPYAFSNAAQLQSIVLPQNITEIPENAFEGCTSLTSVELPAALTSISEKAFSTCRALTSIDVPETVTSIGEEAFGTCSALTRAVLPSGLTEIADKTFMDCRNLKTLKLPENLKKIGASAFANAGLAGGITLPSKLESIGKSAFTFDQFTSIQIPDSVTEIGESAFAYSSLCSITLPKGIRVLPRNLFNGCDLETYTIPDGVTTIEDGVFGYCEKLEGIQIPDTVTSIGHDAFNSCKKLKTLKLPEGIPSIGESTFQTCWSLTDITIPASVASIGKNAFDGCSKLKNVHYTGSSAKWNGIEIAEGNDALTNASLSFNDTSAASLAENSVTVGTPSAVSGAFRAVFENVNAGKDYAVVVSRSADDPLNADNLIYINQITAGADGELSVPFRTAADTDVMVYVVACTQDDVIIDPDQPDTPSGGDGGGGAGVAIAVVGGIVAVTAVAGVMMIPVEVSGTVKNAEQAVLPGVSVQVLKNGTVAASTTTDANGRFTVKVRRGSYTLRVSYTGADGQPVTRTVDIKAPSKNMDVAA